MRKHDVQSLEHIASRILLVRGEKVILDFDLALLYGVETRALKQAVKRNQERFPEDFMFFLSEKEIDFLVSQNVIPSRRVLGGALPMAFTEQGIAMLSGVLRSSQAVAVNVAIMRTFVKMRKFLQGHQELASRVDELEERYDAQFKSIFQALHLLLKEEDKPGKKIGFIKVDRPTP